MISKIILLLSTVIAAAGTVLSAPFEHWYDIWVLPALFVGSCAALSVVFLLLIIIVSLTINIRKTYEKYNGFYKGLYNLAIEWFCALFRVRIERVGMDKLPADRRFLFVTNHCSNFDPIVQGAVMKKHRLIYISKDSNFKIPVCRRYMIRCGFLSLDRSSLRSGLKVTRKASELIASGEFSVGVFPEGTRNAHPENGLLDFKHASFKTALWAKSPIVVAISTNTRSIAHNFPFKRTFVRFEIVDVIEYDDIKDMSTQEIADMVRKKIADALAQC